LNANRGSGFSADPGTPEPRTDMRGDYNRELPPVKQHEL
jgi:hypothetical protein